MKKLFYLIIAMACLAGANAQTVGIGTNVPNANAVLDIFSTSKGVLIPRILDTANVSNPLEGLIIYNKNTRSPYYYDGARWLSLGGRLPNAMSSSTDRITYQVTGAGFSANEQSVYALSHGVSLSTSIGGGGLTHGPASLSDFSFVKEFDLNSKSMNLAALLGTKYASIEFKLYASGATIPYLSYRYKNIIISAYQVSGSAGGGALTESVTIAFENYGFKDWVNILEFGFSIVSNMVTSY